MEWCCEILGFLSTLSAPLDRKVSLPSNIRVIFCEVSSLRTIVDILAGSDQSTSSDGDAAIGSVIPTFPLDWIGPNRGLSPLYGGAGGASSIIGRAQWYARSAKNQDHIGRASLAIKAVQSEEDTYRALSAQSYVASRYFRHVL
jgi:hypothetical protein